jgi:hypothetical protein
VTLWPAPIAFTSLTNRLLQENIVSPQNRLSPNCDHPLRYYTTAELHYRDLVPISTGSFAIILGATSGINKHDKQALTSPIQLVFGVRAKQLACTKYNNKLGTIVDNATNSAFTYPPNVIRSSQYLSHNQDPNLNSVSFWNVSLLSLRRNG